MQNNTSTNTEFQSVEAPRSINSVPRSTNIMLQKNKRRSTFHVRPADQDEQPVDNPNYTTQENDELKKEYEAVKTINRTLETVIERFDATRAQISEFGQSLDKTDALLDIWLEILQKADEAKEVIENSELHVSQAVSYPSYG